MSIIISSLLIFFLYLSMHTCNARHLRVMGDNNIASHTKLPYFSTKVLESVKQLNMDNPVSVQEGTSRSEDIVFHERHVVKPKDSGSLLKERKQNREISAVPVSVSGRVARKNLDERTANVKLSTHVGLLGATSIESSRRRGLSINAEHGSGHVKEGRDHNKADEYQLEDASVTDYDPPQQKPPIHNRQP